jgi:hypothetical protein
VAEVEVAVAGVVGLEVSGFAEGIEQGVTAGQQGGAQAAALLVGVDRQVGEVVVGLRGAPRGERLAEDRDPGGDLGRERVAGAGRGCGVPVEVLAEGVPGPEGDPVEAAAGVPRGHLAPGGRGGGDDDLAGCEDVVDDRGEVALGQDPAGGGVGFQPPGHGTVPEGCGEHRDRGRHGAGGLREHADPGDGRHRRHRGLRCALACGPRPIRP